jgi:hypothetical protein
VCDLRAAVLPETAVNRQARRAVERAARKGSADTIRLRGGPMGGWLVTPDAPALQPDWWKTWPDHVAEYFDPGRYVATEETDVNVPIWEWQES